MVKKNRGLADIFSGKSLSELYIYIIICAGCMIAMIVNLAVQNVGMSALTAGSEADKNLLLLTFAVVALCAAAIIFLFGAVADKKDKEKYAKIGAQKGRKR